MNFDLANVAKLTKGVKVLFSKGIKTAVKKDYLDIASEVNTKSHTVDYVWLGNVPGMKHWVAGRQKKKLKDHTYPIAKKDFETSIEVMRDDFVFDNLGIVKLKISQLIHSVTKHYNSLVLGLIKQNGTCFDGKAFFAIDHEVGTDTYSNLTDAQLTEDALFDIIAKMQGIKDEHGEALGIMPTMLLVSPDLLKIAKTILGAKTINGSDNIAQNLLTLKVVQQMDAGTWCVLDTSQPLKPFILQITKVGKLEADTSKMFDEKKVFYGVDTMDNAGYGYWQMAFFSNGTAQ